jgi:hypothetical protein
MLNLGESFRCGQNIIVNSERGTHLNIEHNTSDV